MLITTLSFNVGSERQHWRLTAELQAVCFMVGLHKWKNKLPEPLKKHLLIKGGN